LKLSGLQGDAMERYPSPKLAAEIHFYNLEIAIKNEQNIFFFEIT